MLPDRLQFLSRRRQLEVLIEANLSSIPITRMHNGARPNLYVSIMDRKSENDFYCRNLQFMKGTAQRAPTQKTKHVL